MSKLDGVSAERDEGVVVPRTTCFTDANHPRDDVKECPDCYRFFCPPCAKAHDHYSDDLYMAAQKLKRKYPRCSSAIDQELARLRERGRMGEFRSVAVQEIIIDLTTTV